MKAQAGPGRVHISLSIALGIPLSVSSNVLPCMLYMLYMFGALVSA